MNKFDEAYNNIKAYLSKELTKENTEAITALGKDLDTIKSEFVLEVQEHQKTKNKLVDFVMNSGSSKDYSQNDIGDDTPKSLDDAFNIAKDNMLKARKENKQ